MKGIANGPIYSITPFTLLDYPHKSACILWFAGCNMRCLYCYNPEIVLGKGSISIEKALAFLQSRKNLLDAAVFSGGECLLHKDIVALIEQVKRLGFLVKIDTNGSRPDVLQNLLNRKLIDYVALDYKAMPSSFEKITKSELFGKFEKSLQLLNKNDTAFEVRTTVHSDLTNEEDLGLMVGYLEENNYKGDYFIQHFVNGVSTLGDLGHSLKGLEQQNLSRNEIKIHFRSQ